MHRLMSSFLLLVSAAVFTGSAGMIVAVLAARDAAMWLGGWGLLLLAQPVVTIGLLCLVFGLAMRWLSDAPGDVTDAPAKLHYRIAGWALSILGMLVVADHSVKAAAFAVTTHTDLGVFALLPVLDPRLPLGLAGMFLGLIVLRRAPRQQALATMPGSHALRSA